MPSQQPLKPDTVWNHKPWWCQPWSIALTGVTLMGGSWLLFRAVWVTALVSVPVLVWMVFFLAVYPALVAQSGLLDGSPEDGSPLP